MKGGKKFINLFRSARIERTFPSISLIIFACAISEKINKEIYLLSLCLILLYASGGILNAIKDKDYELPPYSKIIIYILPIITLIISLNNSKIFLASLIWVIFGFAYNLTSRKILLADTSIMSLTHYFIPVFFSLWILGMNIMPAIEISTLIYATFWLIIPLKNLNGINKDKKLGYKTLTTLSKQGKKITIILYYLSFILISYFYYFLELKKIYLFMLIIIGLMYITTGKTLSFPNKYFSIPITRLTMIIFTTSLTLGITTNKFFILLQMPFLLFFTIAFIKEYKK
jgi:4-hydroxybenzoate polyprenyltransferase